jgi:hypothetical protein
VKDNKGRSAADKIAIWRKIVVLSHSNFQVFEAFSKQLEALFFFKN